MERMRQNKGLRKWLSVMLAVVMVLGYAGLFSGLMTVRTYAATANSYDSLRNAINTANSASGTTTIQLTGNISGGEVAALPTITKNVILNLNGYSISWSYSGETDRKTSNGEYQLPSENQGVNDREVDYLDKGMFNVGSAGTLQIINTSSTSSSVKVETQITRVSGTKAFDNTGTLHGTASSTLIYSEGTVVLGDKSNASYNNFTLNATATATNRGNAGADRHDYHAHALAFTVTTNSDSSRFYMYGGSVEAYGKSRCFYDGRNHMRVYALNFEKVYSAEIYGGSAKIINASVECETSTDCDGDQCWASAIRCHSPNVFIFNVNAEASGHVGADTSEASLELSSVLCETSPGPLVYGGYFKSVGDRSSSDNGDLHNHTIQSYNSAGWRLATGGNIAPTTSFQSGDARYQEGSNTLTDVFYTKFVFADANTNNGVYPWNYATFRDFISAHTSSSDAHFADSSSHWNDNNNKTPPSSKLYTRTGYTHTGWTGTKCWNAGTYSDTSSAGLNASNGGSIFFYPTWTINTYKLDVNGYLYTVAKDTGDNDGGLGDKAKAKVTIDGSVHANGNNVNDFYESITYNKPYVIEVTPVAGWKMAGIKEVTSGVTYTTNTNTDALIKVSGNIAPKDFGFRFAMRPKVIKLTLDPKLYKTVNGAETSVNALSNGTTATYYKFEQDLAQDTSNTSTTGTYFTSGSNANNTVTGKITSITKPTRTGYTFGGYYTGKNGAGTQYINENGNFVNDAYKHVTADTTLYAKWTPNVYTVTLDNANATTNGTATVYEKYDTGWYSNSAATTAITSITAPVRTGWTFKGYYTQSNGQGTQVIDGDGNFTTDSETALTSSCTLYAYWTINSYTLTIDPALGKWNDSTETQEFEQNFGTTKVIPNPYRNGYTFTGWTNAGNGTIADDSVVTQKIYTFGDSDGTLTANWSANTYTVTYSIGTTDALAVWADDNTQKSVVFDSVMTDANFPATVPTRPGYTFEGWNTVQNKTTANFAVGDTFTNAGAITVYAAWKPITYAASFNANGGSAAAAQTFTRPDGFTFPTSSRTGYTLTGWQVSAGDGNWNGDETVYAAGAPVSDKYGDVTFVAQWEANEYTVTYSTAVADSATNLAVTVEPASFTATYDAALGELAVPTRDGFDFAGWYLDAALTQAVDSETEFKTSAGFTANNNNVLYSKWTPKTYHITVLDASGYEIAALSRDYTPVDSFTIVPPVITGKTFDVWVQRTVNQGNWSEGRYSAETVFAGRYGDVTLQANYLEVQYKAYWYNGDTLMQFENFSTGEMVDHTLHVLGSLPYVTVVPTKESTPEKTFEFEGWFDANGNAPHTLTEADITNGDDTTFTFYARYIEHDRAYTVNWNVTGLPGATTYAPSQVVWGTAFGAEGFTLPEGLNTTVEGYDCEIKVRDTVVTDAYVMPKSDITVDVTFTAQDRTIDWYSEDGNTLLVSTVQKYGEDVHTPAQSGTAITVPEKAGDSKYQSYTFNDRWSNLALGEPVNLGVVATPDASEHMSFYVSYTHGDPVEYTVTWVIASDVVDPAYRSRTTTVGYGEPLSINIAPEIPVVDGYAIMWNFADAPDTMPDSNITINAVVEAGSWIVRWNVTGRQEVMTMVRDGEQAVPTNVFTDRPTDSKYSYTFIGWSSDPDATEYDETPAADSFYAYEDGGVNELPLISQASARTFYAVYLRTAQEYTITWKVDNRVVQVDTVAYGQPVTEYAVPEKPGKTFVGWIDDLGAEVEIPATMIDRDIIANAVYETTRYTFRWYADGRLVDTTVFDYNVKPFTNVTPTKASTAQYDYSFIGWALTPDATAADVIQYMQPATADGEFYAVFESTLRQYRLRIFRDGRVVSSETTFVANGASLEATLNAIIENYQRNGYDAKWTEVSFDDDNTFIQGADFTVAGAVMPTNNFDLNIAYTAKNYTITWIIDGVESYTEVPYGELITHEDPTKASDLEYNYTFTGWSPKLTSNTRCTGEATFEANFSATPREYTITWVGFGKTETSTARVGATISYTRPVPAKEGHTGQWVQQFESMPAEDITINAEYTPRVYRVTWKADGRTLYTEEVTFGAAIPSKEIPEKDGYTGVWDNEVETMPARNIVITAVYSLKTWAITVKFATDDSYNHEVTYNSTYTANFVAANGSLPEDIIVSVSGKKIGANNYTYSADGSFVLNANVITGPVTIVDAVEGSQVVIDEIRVNGLQPIAGRTAKAGMAYHVQFIAMQGYELPTDVDVYIDGERLTSGYSYDARTGRLTINGEKMYGTVRIVPLEPEKKPDAPTPTDPSDPGNQGGGSGSTCPYCGKVHTGFFGFLVQFFHMILYFFRNLFGRG